jgi:hypothetical protein
LPENRELWLPSLHHPDRLTRGPGVCDPNASGLYCARPAWCLCMHRPARCLETTSPDVSDIGQGERCPPICSSLTGAIDWMRERFIELSMRCLDRSVCEASCRIPNKVGIDCWCIQGISRVQFDLPSATWAQVARVDGNSWPLIRMRP